MPEEGNGSPRVRGVVFDLDGTLVVQELNFDAIRREIGLPTGTPLLEALENLSGAARARAWEILRRHERTAAEAAQLNPGVSAFVHWLDGQGIRRGLLSRNSREAVSLVLSRCSLRFDTVVAREDAPYKPHPQGLWQICQAWQLLPTEVLMIGDYLYDVQVGRNAGTRTALITHGRSWPFADLADVTFPSFEELPGMLHVWLAAGP